MKKLCLLIQQIKVFLQNWYGIIIKSVNLKFKGSCLKQEDKVAFTPKNVVNFFIVYELDSRPEDLDSDFTQKNCLFRGGKLPKNPDLDKHSDSRYGIGCDTRIEFSLPDGSAGKNCHYFWS